MPSLENPKHEAFALLLCLGRKPEDAYAEAGYTADGPNALRLAKRRDVQYRVREIREGTIPTAPAAEMPRDETSMLEYLREVALGRRPGSQTQVAAARAALSASAEAQRGSDGHWRPIRGRSFGQADYDRLLDSEIALFREIGGAVAAGYVVDNRDVDWKSWPISEQPDEPREPKNSAAEEVGRKALERKLAAYRERSATSH